MHYTTFTTYMQNLMLLSLRFIDAKLLHRITKFNRFLLFAEISTQISTVEWKKDDADAWPIFFTNLGFQFVCFFLFIYL